MKKLFLGSAILAALVFSGCGSSSHDKVDPNPSGGTKNPSGGTENPGGGTGNSGGGTTTYPGETVTIGGLEWTVLNPDNDDANTSNNEIDGRVTQNEANAKCIEWGMELATKEQLDSNLTALRDSNTTFNKTGSDKTVIWYNASEQKGLFIDFSGDGSTEDYVGDDWTATSTNYFTCIKPAQ